MVTLSRPNPIATYIGIVFWQSRGGVGLIIGCQIISMARGIEETLLQ